MKRLALCAALLGGAACAAVPTPDQVRTSFQASEARLLDRDGVPLQMMRLDARSQRTAWVPLAEVSPALVNAILRAEDQHFMEHAGVDLSALTKAAWENLFRSRPRGASTITMQLAALLDPALQAGAQGRTLGQKWDQILAARELEQGWTKGQVLEAYLNLVPFRGELRGVGAAARGLFGKAPSGLDGTESAILASLVRAPAAAPKLVARRACALGRELALAARCDAIEWETVRALGRPADARVLTAAAPVAARLLKPGRGDLRSTLDARLQRFAEEALRRQLAMLRGRNVGDGALVVLDNASGEILAYVANAGGSEVDGVLAPRQAGSTLKPFLYELALERRLLTAASVLDDAPLDIQTPGGMYVPQNYEKDFKGRVSVRTSLAGSLNIPAVRTLMLVGPERFHARLRQLGLHTLTEAADFYGYSLALGSGEVTLLDLANAYRTLANGGAGGTPTLMPRGAERRQPLLDPRASWVVADILSDRAARSVTFGLSNELATTYWSAVKTGTSKDMRDNWALGFSPRYTVGVWVGNFDGQSMWDVSGVSGAAPVWRDVMDYLHQAAPPSAPAAPAGLVRANVEYEDELEAARPEWFLAGTEVARIGVVEHGARAPRILYPAEASILAVDPDIPAQLERVLFQAQAGKGLTWQLDGQSLGDAGAPYAWKPEPGVHRLALIDAAGRAQARASFSVRGAK